MRWASRPYAAMSSEVGTAVTIAEGRTGVRRAAVWRRTEGGAAPDEGAVQDPVQAAALNRRTTLTAILDAASE